MKTGIVVTLAVFAQALGNTFLSMGMKAVSSSEGGGFQLSMLVRAMSEPTIWAGTALLVLFFALFAAALSWADLSLVLPATATGYILNVASAAFILGEHVSSARWGGSLLILAGVVLVTRSRQPGTSPDTDLSPRQHTRE